MAFSSALTLTDLNDFLTPSQACIKPLDSQPQPGPASTQIRIDAAGSYYELSDTQSTRKLEQAQISLNDCLACSGCITSAESVLITLQSHTEVLNVLDANPPPSSPDHRVPILSVSPQSLASLAASLSSSSASPVSPRQILYRLRAFCQHLGFFRVYDTTFARHIALLDHVREFQERKLSNPSLPSLPMLASACPGWVCYAEKTHAEMLPFISRTKSPQQVMGTLVKNWLARQNWHKTPDKIYHVTVMPCYDKKLEASRQDFYNDLYATRDVDCVLTTGELEIVIKDRGWDLSVPVRAETERDLAEIEFPELLTHPGTSSGSYLHALLAAHSTPTTELTTRTIRSADYEEFLLTDSATGKVVFKGAKCYGFRNLQNLVRKVGKEAGVQVGRGAAGRLKGAGGRGTAVRLKRGAKEGGGGEEDKKFDYVEVMACPSGCVNGGGQLKQPQTTSPVDTLPSAENPDLVTLTAKWGDKDWVKKVEQAYWHGLPTPPDSPGPTRGPSLESERPSATPTLPTTHSSSTTIATSPPRNSLAHADTLALRVLADLCIPESELEGRTPPNFTWHTPLSDASEALRRSNFRTQYRAVESEVLGIQVKW